MNNKVNPKNYLYTFAITILAVVIFIICLQINIFIQVFSGKVIDRERNVPKTKNWEYLIEQYKLKETEEPQNYQINYSMARLYEYHEKYSEAEIEYKKVIYKSNSLFYNPIFDLANMYTNLGYYDSAKELAGSVSSLPIKKVLRLKEKFYKNLGDKFYEKKMYDKALEAYSQTIYFRQKISKKSSIKDIQENLTDTYVALSEVAILEGDTGKALNYINTALNYKKVPILYYKLALLYLNKDAEKAYFYMNKTRQLDPTIINYALYEKLLKTLSEKTADSSKAEVYEVKIRNLHRFLKATFVTPSDIKITYLKKEAKLNPLTGNGKINVEFQLKNISDVIIKNLFMYVEITDNEEIIHEQKIVVASITKKMKLEDVSKIYKIKSKIKRNEHHIIKCKIYMTKNKNIPLEIISEEILHF